MTNKNEMPVVGKRYFPKHEKNPFHSAVFRDSFVSANVLLYRFDCIYKDSRKAGGFSITIEQFYDTFITENDSIAIDEVKVNGDLEEALRMVRLNLLDYDLDYLKDILPELREVPHFQLIERVKRLVDAVEKERYELAVGKDEEDVEKSCPNCKGIYFSLPTDPTKFCSPDCEAESEGVKVPCVGVNCEGCNCEEANGNKQVESEKETKEESCEGAVNKEEASISDQEKPKSLWKDVSELKRYGNNQYLLLKNYIDDKEVSICKYIGGKIEGFLGTELDVPEDVQYVSLTELLHSFEQLQRDVEVIKLKIK